MTSSSLALLSAQALDLLAPLYHIPRGQIAKALSALSELGSKYQEYTSPYKTLDTRIHFIGSYLTTSVEKNSKYGTHLGMQAVILELCNLKNALQVEAIFFGTIYPSLKYYSTLIGEPKIKTLLETLPEIFQNISFEGEELPHFKINIQPFMDYVKKKDISALSTTFDILMFKMLSLYTIEDGSLIIPRGALPPKGLLEYLMEHAADEESQLFSQILYACYLDEELFKHTLTLRPLSVKIISMIAGGHYYHYSQKGDLVPFLDKLLKAIQKLVNEGKNPEHVLVEQALFEDLAPDELGLWLESAATSYELVRKIELGARKLFAMGELAAVTEVALLKACDPQILDWAEAINANPVHLSHAKKKYPLSKQMPFAGTKEEFSLLPHYKYLSACFEFPHPPKVPSKIKIKKKPQAAVLSGGSCAVESCVDTPPPSPVRSLSPEAKTIDDAFRATQEFLEGITVSQRVSLWEHLPEEALKLYRFDESKAALSKEEMILRHQFPKDIALAIFNELYSLPKNFLKDDSRVHRSFHSCLMIDEKKYILEATLDEDNTLYHLYARPLRSTSDYFEWMRIPSEFPMLGHKGCSKDTFEGLNVSFFEVLDGGHLGFSAWGHSYKILNLKLD